MWKVWKRTLRIVGRVDECVDGVRKNGVDVEGVSKKVIELEKKVA